MHNLITAHDVSSAVGGGKLGGWGRTIRVIASYFSACALQGVRSEAVTFDLVRLWERIRLHLDFRSRSNLQVWIPLRDGDASSLAASH